MKKITTSRQSNRRPARERKTPDGVQNQLSKRRSNSASRKRTDKLDMNTTLEQQINEGTEVTTAEAPKNQKAEFTRGQVGKIKRSFAKAGKETAPQDEKDKFLRELIAAGIDVMDLSSTAISRVLKGEATIEDLKK